mmetsp:Transcript_41986/g.97330  ORF Transcript_41986/g.97330 Transcript_41986/m.97330 type:complete len:176 (-) Transcript_41986:1-528(-)
MLARSRSLQLLSASAARSPAAVAAFGAVHGRRRPLTSPGLHFPEQAFRRSFLTFSGRTVLPSVPLGSRAMSSLPSHVALTMPALSPTMTAGTISKWMIKVGQKIAPGDQICDIETDKATIAWESQEDGVIAKILVEEGAGEVPVGQVVLVVCDDEADVAAFANYVAEAAPAASAT